MEQNPSEFTRHNHDDGKAMPWGRKKPPGECPRCDELRAGAKPREAHPAIKASIRRRELDEQSSLAIREHFASDKHRSGGCGPVCTYGDW